MSIIKALGIGLLSFPISRLVLVLVLTEIPNKDNVAGLPDELMLI